MRKSSEKYRQPPGPTRTYRRPQNSVELPLPVPNVIVVLRQYRPRWSSPDEGGRQTCLVCDGTGERAYLDEDPVDCGNCDAEGYRWVETAT